MRRDRQRCPAGALRGRPAVCERLEAALQHVEAGSLTARLLPRGSGRAAVPGAPRVRGGERGGVRGGAGRGKPKSGFWRRVGLPRGCQTRRAAARGVVRAPPCGRRCEPCEVLCAGWGLSALLRLCSGDLGKLQRDRPWSPGWYCFCELRETVLSIRINISVS